MKKLPNALAAATFLAPMGVAALGVGDIELHSALNQPLSAKIALVAARSELPSDIKVSLASPEAFKRAGIDRYFYLSNIRFKPIVAADGSLSIKVTSHDIVREPFLNFLVEVNWPQGRALKEFTVLLDPPVTLREAEPVIQRAPVARRTTERPSSTKQSGSTPRSSVVTNRSVTGSGVSAYGPTQKNDTLWAVATNVNNDPSISQEQMMMSLYKKNPQAFYKKNVNALKRGQTLQVPSREEVLQLTKAEARREFSDHYKVWTAKVPAAEPKEKASQQEKTVSESLPSSDNVEDADQLTLLTPADEESASAAGLSEQDSGAGGNAASMADMAIEISETVRQENEDIQKRMAALEEQVSTMQRLLVLKDEQLAALQGSQAVENVSTEEAGEPAEESDSGSDIALETPKPEKVEVETVTPPVQETAFYEDPLYLGAGGVGLLVLALVAIAGRRKKALEEDAAEAESILIPADESPEPSDELIAPVVDSSESEAGIPAESSFLSEFTPSDFDTLESDNDEVDPITEADVYLAYGRYQQAEDLVRQAIENDPENEEYKLKLLEIHFATEDKSAFLSLAKEIHADCGGADSDLWMRAVEMGQDMCPEEPLFQNEEDEPPYAEDDGQTMDDLSSEVASEPLSEEEHGEESFESVELESSEEPEESSALDFDIGGEAKEEAAAQDEEEPPVLIEDPESNLIDFASSEPEEELEITAPVAEEEIEVAQTEENSDQNKEESDGFDFDFEMVSPEGEEEALAEPEAQKESESLELDLDFGDDVAASLTDMDEVETKLDLAKAYVDMEDEDAAKSILQEVLEQGNDEQKSEAQSLMDGLKG